MTEKDKYLWGKKCLLCDTKARHHMDYCIKHNPKKCIIENCNGKPIDNTDFCLRHNEKYHCEYQECIRKRRKNGFCIKHAENEYCIKNNCDKIAQLNHMCDEHYCSGNISRIAKRLINYSKSYDSKYKGSVRKDKRHNNITWKDIVNLYDKNKNCFWCNYPVVLEIGGDFDLDRISIDRLDNKSGHCKNNCIITCKFCNLARNECSKEEWVNIINILKGNTNIIDFKNHEVNVSMVKYMTGMYKEKRKHGIETVDEKWLFDRLNETNWFCEISNIPLFPTTTYKYPFNISIDRIDNNQFHTKTNCQLTCTFINYGKNRMEDNKFKLWFRNRFPNCKIDTIIYPRELYDKILYKYKETYVDLISNTNIKIYFV